jgi:hypothetical protein
VRQGGDFQHVVQIAIADAEIQDLALLAQAREGVQGFVQRDAAAPMQQVEVDAVGAEPAPPSPYISAVSTSVIPRSSPRRSAATSSARAAGSSPMFQVPWPSAGMVRPDGKLKFFIRCLLPVCKDTTIAARGNSGACSSKRALVFVIF